MPWNGSGNFTQSQADFVNGTTIDEVAVNAEVDNLVAGIGVALAKDGQNAPTANLPMATFRHTNVGAASAATHYLRADQAQKSSLTWCGTAGGTANALALTPAPAITAYAAGHRFQTVIATTNTSATVTVDVSSVGAATVLVGGVAPPIGYLLAGYVAEFLYTGSAFELLRQDSPLAHVGATLPLLGSPEVANGALTFLGRGTSKTRAVSRTNAIAMADDHAGMLGYAAEATAVTGGAGKLVYWVTNGTDNRYDPEVGSLRAAVNLATAAGGGRILIDPLIPIEIYLDYEIQLPANTTLDAPGRNCHIIRQPVDLGVRLVADNCIVRRIRFSAIPGVQSTIRGGLQVNPYLCHSFWIYECTFDDNADGATDCAANEELVADTKGTIARCLYRNHDKTMIIGSLSCFIEGSEPAWCSVADTEPSKLFVTIHDNLFEHCGQRNPFVNAQGFAHVHGNVHRLVEQDQFGSDTVEFGASYGTRVGTGGMALSEYNLYTIANDTGYVAVGSFETTYVAPVSPTAGTHGPGNCKSVGDVVMNSMTITERNASSVPVPPYTLTAPTLVDTAAGRDARMAELYAIVGAEMNPFDPYPYRWDAASTQTPDGKEILAINNDIAGRLLKQGGREYMRPEPSTMVKVNQGVYDINGADILFKVDTTQMMVTTRATRVPRESSATLASDTLTLTTAAGYYTVSNEAAAASDNLSTLTITPSPQDGQEIRLMPASTIASLVIKHNVGNILLPGGVDKTLDGAYRENATLFWADHASKWVLKG